MSGGGRGALPNRPLGWNHFSIKKFVPLEILLSNQLIKWPESLLSNQLIKWPESLRPRSLV